MSAAKSRVEVGMACVIALLLADYDQPVKGFTTAVPRGPRETGSADLKRQGTLKVTRRSGMDLKGLDAKAEDAARFLRAIASGPRLLILCLLEDGEMSVGAIADATGLRLPAVSQNLALLKAAGVVASRRDGTTVFYALASDEARAIMLTLQNRFCPPKHGSPQG